MPFIVVEVCGDYARFPAVALAHEFKEGVYLFGVEGEVPELVDDQQVVPGESVDELICRAVGKGAVELIKKVLSVVEASAVAGDQSLSKQSDSEPGFAGARWTDEDDILGFADEIELRESHDLAFIDCGLFLKGEAFQGPGKGDFSLFEPIEHALFLAVGVFCGKQAVNELAMRAAGFLGAVKLLYERFFEAREVQPVEQFDELSRFHDYRG